MSSFNRQQQDDIRRLIDRTITRKNNNGSGGGGGGGGATDHGDLDGLADDDHAQYHNDTRGDARYYTKSQSDATYAASSHTHVISSVTNLQSTLDGKAAVNHTHSLSNLTQSGATTNQVATWNGSQWAPSTVTAGALTYDQAFLASDVALTTQGVWYTGPSLVLSAGTWLIMASATVGRTTTTAGNYNIRINSNGTTNHASTQQFHTSAANNWASLSCNAIVVLAGSTTMLLQACGSIAGDVLKAITPNNASGTNATSIVAVRIA